MSRVHAISSVLLVIAVPSFLCALRGPLCLARYGSPPSCALACLVYPIHQTCLQGPEPVYDRQEFGADVPRLIARQIECSFAVGFEFYRDFQKAGGIVGQLFGVSGLFPSFHHALSIPAWELPIGTAHRNCPGGSPKGGLTEG